VKKLYEHANKQSFFWRTQTTTDHTASYKLFRSLISNK